jgi:hypothetical protein
MLGVAPDLIRPENDNAVELSILCLLHRHGNERVRGEMAVLTLEGNAATDDAMDVRAREFRTA